MDGNARKEQGGIPLLGIISVVLIFIIIILVVLSRKKSAPSIYMYNGQKSGWKI